jgi:hypothetical protein
VSSDILNVLNQYVRQSVDTVRTGGSANCNVTVQLQRYCTLLDRLSVFIPFISVSGSVQLLVTVRYRHH